MAAFRFAALLLAVLAPLAALHAQSNYATPYTFTTLAGSAPEFGSADGTGNAARFYLPAGMAADSTGNVYVADTANHTIRKITSSGEVITIAGSAGSSGSLDGTGSAARFYYPYGVAIDGLGNVYVADTGNRTIRKMTTNGVVTTLAGTAGNLGSADGTGGDAEFNSPLGVAVDSAGNLYVSDTDNGTIRKITAGGVVTTFAGTAGNFGSADGTGSAAQFSYPSGIAVDSTANLYVADANNQTIRKISSLGVVTTLAGSPGNWGSADGTGNAAQFINPYGVAVDSAGNIFVADTGNLTIRKITSGGVVTTFAGTTGNSGTTDGIGGVAQFISPFGITVDGSGNVYVAERQNHVIRKITTAGSVTTLAGKFSNISSADGTGSAAGYRYPSGATVDNVGNVYVADTGNHTVRKITAGGVVTTFAGLAGSAGSADGTGSTARFNGPYGVAVDNQGNVYVADNGNHTIRKISSLGVVTTLAGTPETSGSADGTGSAAKFSYPSGLTVDGTGNVYVADSNNHTIRKVTPGGVVTTLAGTAGSSGAIDGIGSAALFNAPNGVAVDAAGNLYVADSGNYTVRKITAAGVVTTIAGTGGSNGSTDGIGNAARFNSPAGIAVDSAGNLYVADIANIRKITSDRIVTTIAGVAEDSGAADGTGSAARFDNPYGLAVDSAGTLYVADTSNHTIRFGTLAPPVLTSADSANAAFGQSFTYEVVFSGAPTSYSASGLPTGLSLDTATGVISGTPVILGTFPVTLGATNAAGSGSGTLTITVKNSQSITFGPLTGKNYGDAPFTVSATASSGLTPTYNIVSGPATVSGNLVTLTGGGIVVVRASQAGDSSYAAAQVDRSFTVSTPYTYTFATLAGTFNVIGSANGTGSNALFSLPEGVAVDGAGNVYVADRNNHTIRKITAVGIVSTFAGTAGVTGSADGTGSAARFNNPMDLAVDGSGNVYVADGANCTIRKITSAGVVTTFAGLAGSSGFVDATGSAARFGGPAGLAVDTLGNVYVADAGCHTIRKISPAGAVTTLAGSFATSGSTDGTGSAARFFQPMGLAVDVNGNVYVADTANHAIRKITPGGVVTTLAGLAGNHGSTDGLGSAARFYFPWDVAVDASGKIYVADSYNSTIRMITPAGVVITVAGTPGNNGSTDGTGSAALFGGVLGIALDSAGNLFVGDGGNTIRWGALAPPGQTSATTASGAYGQNFTYTVTFSGALNGFTASGLPTGLTIAPSTGVISGTPAAIGTFPVTLGATNGAGNGTGTVTLTIAKANQTISFGPLPGKTYGDDPFSVSATASSGLDLTYSIVSGPATISGDMVTLTGAGTVIVRAAQGGDANYYAAPQVDQSFTVGKATTMVSLSGLSATYDGTAHAVQASQSVVSTLAGLSGVSGSADGTGSAARFGPQAGLAVDSAGNVYVGDYSNGTIRKITPAGIVTTLAGSAGVFSADDGLGSSAGFGGPWGVAVDGSGNVYVADNGHNNIRKVTSGGMVTTLAGLAGTFGSTDGTGSSARFNRPVGVAVDAAGNVYAADSVNHTIRKITSAGVVTTIAGTGGSSGSTNGTGGAALFNEPFGVAVDAVGTLYVADRQNHVIRKITAGGVVTTLAGLPGSLGWADGTGSAARFNSPSCVAVDGNGSIYVGDGSTIRKITAGGVVTTLAGKGNSYGSANGAGVIARFDQPFGLAVDGAGNLYVADSSHTIRKIVNADITLNLTYNGSSTVPTAAGSYTVVGTLDDPNLQGTATGTLVIAMASQTITFGSLATKNYGDAPFTVSASASSGLTPTYSIVSGPATISGNTVTLTGGGIVTVRATQAGNSNYHAATSVDQSFTANQVPTITTQPASKTVPVGSPVILLAAASGFPVPTYQWQKNGVNIPGATSSTYPISRVSQADAASYRVIATNPVATVATHTVTLSVVALPGDFNGDNQTDILWQNSATGALRLWLMNGTAKASESTLSNVGAGWQVAGTADFNGDNQTDILWQNTVTGERGYWPMTGTSQSGYQPIATVDPVWNIGGAADFNGDGHPDIIWENTLTGERGIWLLNGVSLIGWEPLGTLAVQWNAAGTGDFNADGTIDLVWQNTLTGERKVWLMNGSTKSSEVSLGFVALAWSIGAVADYNGDGKSDIYFQNTLTGERAIWLMNGTTLTGYAFPPTESTDWVIGRIPSRPAAADFNRDGKPDVVWQNTSTGERKVWLMNGTVFGSEVSFGAVGLPWQIAGTGDLDGDGRCDILWQNTSTGERIVWLMLGTNLSGFVPLGTIATSWQMVGTADFNHDNRTDIVWQNTSTGERGIWLMAGTTLSGWVSLGNVATAWQIAGVADFNRDDNPDLLWQNTSTGERKVWYMNGTTFTSDASFGTVALPWQMVGTGDYNLDGSTDIVWQNASTGERGIWLLNGTSLSGYVDLGTQPLAWQIAN